jgi:hypothetical protein
MTMDVDGMDPLDELASAYLDDEVTPTERARVEGDPMLLQRVEALRAARHVLASDLPLPPPGLEDAQLERAIALADARGMLRAQPARSSNVVSFPRRAAPYAGAVAAVAATLLLLAGFFGQEASSQFMSVGGSISGAGGVAMPVPDDRDDAAVESGDGVDAALDPSAAGDEQGVLSPEVSPTTAPTEATAYAARNTVGVDAGVPVRELPPVADVGDLRASLSDTPLSEQGPSPTGSPSTSTSVPSQADEAAGGTCAAAWTPGRASAAQLLAALEAKGLVQVAAFTTVVAGNDTLVLVYGAGTTSPPLVSVVVPADGCGGARLL